MVKKMIQWFFLRNIVLMLLSIGIFTLCVNARECFEKRGRYLLGIAYNGEFLNTNDNAVYVDYLKRHGSTHEKFQERL